MTVVAASHKTDNPQASFQVAVKSVQLLLRPDQGIDAMMQVRRGSISVKAIPG
jgi:hypothetical protein